MSLVVLQKGEGGKLRYAVRLASGQQVAARDDAIEWIAWGADAEPALLKEAFLIQLLLPNKCDV